MDNIISYRYARSGEEHYWCFTGKTLGYQFLDSDIVIQEMEGALLQDIIDHKGLAYFEELEEKAVVSIEVKRTVIATGGSVIYSEKAMAHLKALGRIVYLNVPYEEIERRLNNIETRGIAIGANESLRDLYNKRAVLYEKFAEHTITCLECSMETVVLKINSLIN